MLDRPFQIGRLTVPNRTILAPLAGVSDPPFRRICQEFGAGLTYVEMLSSVAVNVGNDRTIELMQRHPSESLLGVQLTGRTVDEVAEAIKKLDAYGYDTIDINMGCPVRKIVANGSGCGFLKEPGRISATVEASRSATSRPLTVKTRLGYERGECTVEDTARRVARAGADMLTIHGRYRNDNYAVAPDHEAMARGFAAAGEGLAKVGNGEVMDYGTARAMVDATGCDAVMVSRGALGNPWIFRELLLGRTDSPAVPEWRDVVLRHIQYHEEFYGDHELSARRIRKHLIWYASGFPKANRERNNLNVVESLREARELINAFASALPKDLVRFQNPDDGRITVDPKYQMDRTADAAVATE